MTDILNNIETGSDLYDATGLSTAAPTTVEPVTPGLQSLERRAELSKQWLVTKAIFSVTRSQMLEEAIQSVATDTGAAAEPVAQASHEASPELTPEERLVEDAYKMAKRAVRIALKSVGVEDVKDYAKTLIGSESGVQAKAQGYVSFILEIMPDSIVVNPIE